MNLKMLITLGLKRENMASELEILRRLFLQVNGGNSVVIRRAVRLLDGGDVTVAFKLKLFKVVSITSLTPPP